MRRAEQKSRKRATNNITLEIAHAYKWQIATKRRRSIIASYIKSLTSARQLHRIQHKAPHQASAPRTEEIFRSLARLLGTRSCFSLSSSASTTRRAAARHRLRTESVRRAACCRFSDGAQKHVPLSLSLARSLVLSAKAVPAALHALKLRSLALTLRPIRFARSRSH